MGRPGWCSDQVPINVRLVNGNIHEFPTGDRDVRADRRVTGAGAALKNSRRSENLGTMTDSRYRFVA